MPILSIQYDLYKEPGRVYGELIRAIKQFPWCKITESSWFIRTTLKPEQVRERLRPHLHRRDKTFIMRVKTSAPWAGTCLPDDVVRWLHQHLETVPTRA